MLLLNNASLRPMAGIAHELAFEEAGPDSALPLVTITTFDVILILRETAQGLVGTCIYKPALFGVRTIDRLLRDFRKVLEEMVAQPERPISAIRLLRPKQRGAHVRTAKR